MISSVGRISRVAMTCRPNVSLFSTLNGRQTEPSSKCLDMQYSEQTGILQYWHCSEVAMEHRKHGAVMMPPVTETEIQLQHYIRLLGDFLLGYIYTTYVLLLLFYYNRRLSHGNYGNKKSKIYIMFEKFNEHF